MKRILQTLAIAILALLLAACQTAPAAAPTPAVTQTTVDLMLAVRAKELELERLDKMSWIKFAVESGSEFAKGMVTGMSASGGGKASAQSGTAQSVMQAQAQADNTALRREEMAYANSWDRRLLPYVGLGLDFAKFSRGLGFQRYQIDQANSQTRYTLDTLRGAQTDAYTAGSGAALGGVNAGAGATLGGLAAAAEPAPAPTAAE